MILVVIFSLVSVVFGLVIKVVCCVGFWMILLIVVFKVEFGFDVIGIFYFLKM